MIIRIIYSPQDKWDCRRYEVNANTLMQGLSVIDIPKELSNGDIVVRNTDEFLRFENDELLPIKDPHTLRQNPPPCDLCVLHKRVIRVAVPPDVKKKNPTILIVGMAPGREEDVENKPFVESAPAGGLIRNLISNTLKLPDDEIAWTNVVKCFPNDEGVMRDPYTEEMLTCSGKYLWKEILDINPKVIVTLGNTATNFVLGIKEAITKIRGSVFYIKIGDKKFRVIPTIHPSAIARGEVKFLKDLTDDITFAYSIGITDWGILPKHILLNETEQAIGVMKKIVDLKGSGKIKSVALDIETDQIWRDESSEEIDISIYDKNFAILGFGLSYDPEFGFFIPLFHPESKVDVPKVLNVFKELLDKVPLDCHNGKYDQSWIHIKHGIQSTLLRDTMLDSSIIYGSTRRHGLKGLLAYLFKWPAYDLPLSEKINALPKEQRSYRNAPLAELAEYCVYDTCGTRKLADYFDNIIKERGIEHLRANRIRGSELLRSCQYHGAYVDLRRLQNDEVRYAEMDKLDIDYISNLPTVRKFLGDGVSFGTNSRNHMVPVFFGYSRCKDCGWTTLEKSSRGCDMPPLRFTVCPGCNSTNVELHKHFDFPIIEYTNRKAPSIGKEVIEELLNRYCHRHPANLDKSEYECSKCNTIVVGDGIQHPNPGQDEKVNFLYRLHVIRKRSKISEFLAGIRSHLRPYQDKDNELAILVFNYMQHLVNTGRLNAFDYSIHTLPKLSDARRVIVSKWIRSGGLVGSSDFSQLELRILACACDDPTMIEAFQQGIDIHAQVGSKVYKKTVEEVKKNKPLRTLVKHTVFGIVYGISPAGISGQTGISKTEAEELMNTILYKEFPRVGDWIHYQHEFCRKHGYVESLNGLRFYLPNINSEISQIRSESERQAQNYPIQGSASDINCDAGYLLTKEYERRNLSHYVWLVLHDQLASGIPPGGLFEYLETTHRVMEKEAPALNKWCKVPLQVESDIGARWDGSCTVKEFGRDFVRLEGPENFFAETYDTLKLGYPNAKKEIISLKKMDAVDLYIPLGYNGDRGGENNVEAVIYL